jgi:hypothetical protein
MADKTFTSGTVIDSAWLNDVNRTSYKSVVSCKQFATGDGVTNDTNGLKTWLAFLMANNCRGYWEAGTYLIDEGQLVVEPLINEHTPGVYIETAGFKKTILKGRGTTEAPLLTVRNLTQVSGAGKFIKGGHLGSLGFDGSAQPGGWTSAHALSLRGIDGWTFGYLNGESLRGDLVHIPRNIFAGNNPDPYHVAFCVFDGLQSNFGSGWVLNNDNFVGFTSNEILNVACYGSSTGFGAIRSCAAGNVYKKISVGTCWGWAVDIYDGSLAGRASREIFQIAEFDMPEYGIRCINMDQGEFKQVRFVHRFDSGSGVYWPRTVLQLSNNVNASVSNTFFDFTHRIEGGGTKLNIGKFLDAQNSTGITGVLINNRINDNAGFGFVVGDLTASSSINNSARLKVTGSFPTDLTTAFDSQTKSVLYVAIPGATPIPNGGFGGVGNNVAVGSVQYDGRNAWSVGNYTVPVTGLYRFTASISVSGITAGTRIRAGLYNSTGPTLSKYFSWVTSGTSKHVFNSSGLVQLNAGDIVALNIDANIAAVTTDVIVSAAAENWWSLELVEAII